MGRTITDWKAGGKTLQVKEIDSHVEFREVEQLQIDAWGFSDLDVVPSSHIVASRAAGGLVLGAFDGSRMIGFAYAFPAYEEGAISLHSHMLAVRPSDRNFNAGFHLKAAQRLMALERGIKEITWTFDPLQALNAHFNFTKLGVISDKFLVDFYGELSSSPLHQGLGSDRLWVRWLLDSPRVRARLAGRAPGTAWPTSDAYDDIARRFEGVSEFPPASASENFPDTEVPAQPSATASPVAGFTWRGDRLIEIPADVGELKRSNPELARKWRRAVQRAFLAALDAEYQAEELIRLGPKEAPRWFYVMSPKRLV